MEYLLHIIRCYPFSCLLIVCIWVLCFITPPHTSLDDVAYIDKWTHTAMYLFTCGVIWTEYLRRHPSVSYKKALIGAWLLPTLMSGVIEILQAHCTGGRRSGEWLDFLANSVGTTVAAVIGIALAVYLSRRRKA